CYPQVGGVLQYNWLPTGGGRRKEVLAKKLSVRTVANWFCFRLMWRGRMPIGRYRNSNMNFVIGMPAQIPARRQVEMAEKGIDAGLLLGRAVDVLRALVLFADCVVLPYSLGAVWRQIAGNPRAEDRIVSCIGKRGDGDNRHDRDAQNLLHRPGAMYRT